MYTSIALMTLSLVSTGEELPRPAAAAQLRSALDESRAELEAGASGLNALLSGGQAAEAQLRGSRAAERLAEALSGARWGAALDRAAARERLAAQLSETLDDLEFEPRMEADLPVGFPGPTAVGELELKRYPEYRMGRVDSSGRGGNGAFWTLFSHIKSNDISMTAPVEMTLEEGQDGPREASMAFLYGSTELGRLGSDGQVEVVDIPAAWVVSVGCRGDSGPAALAGARAEIERWLAANPRFEAQGEMRMMGYNSPMVPRSRRYFEVQLPVRAAQLSESSLPLIVDFSDPDELEAWRPVNDVVMGGRSSSRFESTGDATAIFSGVVSLENNGGFASVRSEGVAYDFAGADSLVLRHRGDGKTYKLRLRTSRAFDSVNYEVVFTTEAGAWSEQRFPLSSFRPVWRGREVPGAPALDLSEVRSFGFLISDKQVGEFELEVASIAGLRQASL